MEYIGKEILSGELIPVLLGISREADETAKRMFRQYNVISHVFCERASFPRRIFSLCMKYHPVRHTAGDRLMVTALEDFAVQHATADVILYLIPCTEEYLARVQVVNEKAKDIYRYMNFDQIPAFTEAAAQVQS